MDKITVKRIIALLDETEVNTEEDYVKLVHKIKDWNAELYGASIYLIYYQTKYSIGRFVIHYAYYMTDERFKKKIEKALSSKDIIAVSRMLIPAALWLDVYADKELPIRVTSSGITWEELLHGT